MPDSEVDYGAVLADLKAKRDKLDAAIAGIEIVQPFTHSTPRDNSEAYRNGFGEEIPVFAAMQPS